MLTIKEIENISELVTNAALFDREPEIKQAFDQAIAYVSLVEKIKGLKEIPLEKGDVLFSTAHNLLLTEIKSFIGES